MERIRTLSRPHDRPRVRSGKTGRTWLQAGAQRAVIAVDPQLNSIGIDSRNVKIFAKPDHIRLI